MVAKEEKIMERQFKIALVQYQSVLGDLQKNAERAVEMVREAALRGRKLFVFQKCLILDIIFN